MSTCASPCRAGAMRSLKMRGELTIAACSGCASGTLITSMRNSAEFGSWSGVALTHPGELARRANARRAGDIDVDVVGILRVDERRVRVRAAARLHVADVLRIRDVGDVEDAQTAKSLLAHRVLHALAAAVEAAGESLARDEQKVLVDRHVALRRRAVVRRLERRVARIRDVPDLVAVVAPLDRVAVR